MIKQLIAVATPLLIHDASKTIQYARAILDFTMLAQYVSHDDKTLRYMEHALYRLEKIKIAFEHYRLIDLMLYQPAFNYPNFHAISHFVQCIRNYDSAINYDTAHSETAHKYLLKTFYNRTNKKEYDLQIWQYNVRHTNIIEMKNVILVTERGGKLLAMENADKTAIAEVGNVSSVIDFGSKHSWAISNADMDAAEDLGLTGIKKYWRHAGQIQDEVDSLYKNSIPVLRAFVKHSRRRTIMKR